MFHHWNNAVSIARVTSSGREAFAFVLVTGHSGWVFVWSRWITAALYISTTEASLLQSQSPRLSPRCRNGSNASSTAMGDSRSAIAHASIPGVDFYRRQWLLMIGIGEVEYCSSCLNLNLADDHSGHCGELITSQSGVGP